MGGAGSDEFGWGEIVWGWVEEGLLEVNFIGKAFTRYDQLPPLLPIPKVEM